MSTIVASLVEPARLDTDYYLGLTCYYLVNNQSGHCLSYQLRYYANQM